MARHKAFKNPRTERRLFRSRAGVAMLFVLLMLCGIFVRYFILQVVHYEKYSTQSDKNRIQLQAIAPKRGLIYARNGELLAENIASHTLTITREHVDNLDETLALLQELLSLEDKDIERFKSRMRRYRPYSAIPLRYKLSEQEIAVVAVNRHRMPGVEVRAQLVRHYPYGDLFTHVLGYMGRINDRELERIDKTNYSATEHIGKLGIEKYYEDTLHGQVGYQQVETNARGRVLRVLERTDPVPGQDLHLYLDVEMQRMAQEALGNERGSVVAIDTETGGVVAMVSTPSYDGNMFVRGISSKDYAVLNNSPDLPLFNRAIQGQYPPGSTIKPMFGLAGLHHEVVSKRTTVHDPGWYQLPNDEHKYRDWKKGGHGHGINLDRAITQSCDIYFYDMAYKLGIDRIHPFSAPFGLGERTGIDLPNERSGLLPSRDWKRRTKRTHWYPGETINVGIGQGYMLATPLQLALMTSALANRGASKVPRLLHSLGDEQIVVPEREAIVVEDKHWQVVHRSMENVIHNWRGTAKRIAEGIDYRAAGKTGTAQVVSIAQDEEYDASKLKKHQLDHALFVGYAPAEDPKIAVAVVVENGEHGSSVAAPIARKMFDTWLLGAEVARANAAAVEEFVDEEADVE